MLAPRHPRPWKQAWHDALYGPSGFFLRSVPADHFRTNVAVPLFATAVRRLAERVDAALGFPDPFDVVDVGAGRGELLLALGDVPARWRLTGVDLADADLPFRWMHEIPSLTGLLVANEWLDNVPLEVVQDGRLVLVDPQGVESTGPAADDAARHWCDNWWPAPEGQSAEARPSHRVEVGLDRDLAWAHAVARVDRGLAVAIDYGHVIADRRPSLTGYLQGRQVSPMPDGSRDLTAHVALDSCAAMTGARLLTQREALHALGISAALPDPTDPAYALLLEQASQARELLDPCGLGGFGWLVQTVGLDVGLMPW